MYDPINNPVAVDTPIPKPSTPIIEPLPAPTPTTEQSQPVTVYIGGVPLTYNTAIPEPIGTPLSMAEFNEKWGGFDDSSYLYSNNLQALPEEYKRDVLRVDLALYQISPQSVFGQIAYNLRGLYPTALPGGGFGY